WGMGYYLQVRGAYTFDYTWVWPIEWTNAIVVPLFAVPGILLAIIGQFTGPRPAPTAAGGPSGPSAPSVPGGPWALGGRPRPGIKLEGPAADRREGAPVQARRPPGPG